MTKKERLLEVVSKLDEFDHDKLTQLQARELKGLLNQITEELLDNDLVAKGNEDLKSKDYTSSIMNFRCAVDML